MSAMVTETPTQTYLKAVAERSAFRARAVFGLADELLAYRSARSALSGPALADWTERFESDLRMLVKNAVDSLNDLHDTGSWQRIVRRLSLTKMTIKAENLIQRVQAAIAADFGAQAGAAAAVLTTLLSGATIETEPTSRGVIITALREEHEPVALELTSQRATGDRPRISSASLLSGRPRLAVRRRGIRNHRAGAETTIDAYGTIIELFSALLDTARRDVRTSKRYGRVRVQGQAPAVIAITVLAVLVGASIAYAIGCTGWVNPDNETNQNSDACQVLGALTLIGWVLVLIFGSGVAVARGSGTSGDASYNLNPPSN